MSLKMGEELVVVPSTWEARVPLDYVLLIHQWKGGSPGFFLVIHIAMCCSYMSGSRGAHGNSQAQILKSTLYGVKCIVNVLGH